MFDSFARNWDKTNILIFSSETVFFFTENRAKLYLMCDNAYCHPSCSYEQSPFSKSLHRLLTLLSIYLRGKILYKRLQIVFLFTAPMNMIFCGFLSLFCFHCNDKNFFYHNTTYYFINHLSSLPQKNYFFPVNVFLKLLFCKPHIWSSFFSVVSKSSHMSSATLSCILNFLSTSACLFECVT